LEAAKEDPLKLDGGDASSISSKFSAVCPFCSVAKKEIIACEVFRDRNSVAFLDKRPIFLGHCLLIPEKHVETFLDLPQELIATIFVNSQLVAKAVLKAMNADGILIMINNKVSQSVPHLHLHIIPRRSGDKLRGFMWPRMKYSNEDEMKKTAQAIKSAMQ
jgi:histidine triad (HIT) family protein